MAAAGFKPSQNGAANNSGATSVSGNSSSKSSFEDSIISASIKLQRFKLLAYYHNKTRSGSEGSYGDVNGMQLSRLNLEMARTLLTESQNSASAKSSAESAPLRPANASPNRHHFASFASSNPLASSDGKKSIRNNHVREGDRSSHLFPQPRESGPSEDQSGVTAISSSLKSNLNIISGATKYSDERIRENSEFTRPSVLGAGIRPEQQSNEVDSKLAQPFRNSQSVQPTAALSQQNLQKQQQQQSLPIQVTNPRPTRPSPLLAFGLATTKDPPSADSLDNKQMVLSIARGDAPSRSDSAQSSSDCFDRRILSNKSSPQPQSVERRRTPDTKRITRRDSEAMI